MNTELPIQMFNRPCGQKKGEGRLRSAFFREKVALTGTRLPQRLIDRLDVLAKANYRSRNAEIQARLEASIANESIDEHGVIVVRSPCPIK